MSMVIKNNLEDLIIEQYNYFRDYLKMLYKTEMKKYTISQSSALEKINDWKRQVHNFVSEEFKEAMVLSNLDKNSKKELYSKINKISRNWQTTINSQIKVIFHNVGWKYSPTIFDIPPLFIEESLQKTCNDLQKTVSELQRTISEMTNEKERLQSSVEQLRRENQSLLIEKNKLTQDKQTLYSNIQKMNSDKAIIQKEINNLTDKKNNLLRDNKEMTLRKEDLVKEIEKCNIQLNKIKEENEPIAKRNQELRAEYNELIRQNEEAIRPLNELKTMLTKAAKSVLKHLDDGANIAATDLVQPESDLENESDSDEDNGIELYGKYVNDIQVDGLD